MQLVYYRHPPSFHGSDRGMPVGRPSLPRLWPHIVPDANLYITLIGAYVWFLKAFFKLLNERSSDGSAKETIDTGIKRWVSLRNIRTIRWFSGFTRATQMVATIAALHSVCLDLGDSCELQSKLISIGENLLLQTVVLESEQWPAAAFIDLTELRGASRVIHSP